MIDLDSLKADEGALRRELEFAGVQLRGRNCKCPFHDDRSPSAGIFCKDGVWFFKCHGCGFGGDVVDVRAKLNQRTAAEEIRAMNETTSRPSRPPAPAPKIYPSVEAIAAALPNVEDVYTDLYADPDTGAAAFSVIRGRNTEGKKMFIQCSPTAGGWWMKAPAGPLPIANRAAIRDAERVVVVEGEKCVRQLGRNGIVATTSPGGALKSHLADWSPLAGKALYLWPDADAPEENFPDGKGVEHMRQVQAILQALEPAPTIYFLNPEDVAMGVKEDSADFVARYRGWTPAEIREAVMEALELAAPVGVLADFTKYQEDTINGKRRMLSFPFRSLTTLTNALAPGTVTTVCGDAGSSKSLLVSSECLLEWTIAGVRACVFHLEDDRNFHLARVLAQLDRNAGHTELPWISANAEQARAARTKHASILADVGRCIWEAPAQDQVTHEMVLRWVKERAAAGFEILIIDPITAIEAARDPWISDQRFMFDVKAVAKRTGARIILVTHPKKGRKNGTGLDDYAGGAAFTRFAHTALWIERHQPEKHANVRRSKFVQEQLAFNRTIRITKARNGRGAGLHLAFQFSPVTLRFEELGVVWEGMEA